VIERFRAETVPPATLGVPPTPPALPIVTRGVLELDHGDVLAAVVADHVSGVGVAVADVIDRDLCCAGDHVVVGDHLAVRGHDHAGAGCGAARGLGVDIDEPGIDLRGDRRIRR
jgi:hypothetical protein